MPLDHYVSQVHLKHFNSPELNDHMYAIRKSDLNSFPCNSRSVCRIENGSTNAYLINDRAVEEFLLGVEPKYNASVAKLRENKIDKECIHVIAGFVAYVTCCAPAAMRIHTGQLQSRLETEVRILDEQGVFTRAPASLGSKSLSELLADEPHLFNVDQKYPQALGIDSINRRVSIFGNSKWEILLNGASDSAFFTSDYPVAIEATGRSNVLNRIIPLAPDLAIRIIPDDRLRGAAPDLSFPKFTHIRRTLGRSETININRLIVRCAEDIVFYSHSRDWIANFIAKNCHYRIEAITERIPRGTGLQNVSTQRIVPYRPAA